MQNGNTFAGFFINEAEELLRDNDYKIKKQKLITELYTTGRFNGMYFKRSPRGNVNPLRGYIVSQFKRRNLHLEESMVDDCYNELFVAVCKIDAQKICEIYDESPSKLMATVLQLVTFKCFANDNKPVPNPNHSLVNRLMFTSSFTNEPIIVEDNEPDKYGADKSEEPSGFSNKFGCEVEDIIERLNPQQRADFYEMASKEQRSNESVQRRAKRSELYAVIVKIQGELASTKIAA